MMMRFGTAVTAVVMAVVLTGCGEDDEDCEAAGTTEIQTVAMTDGKYGGTTGSRKSKSSGKSNGSSSGGTSGGKSKSKHKSHSDDDCDD